MGCDHPEMVAERAKLEGAAPLDLKNMIPQAVKNGIMPALAADPRQTFWGTTVGGTHAQRKQVGIDDGPTNVSARSVVHHIKAGQMHDLANLDLPPPCEGTPACEPDVFSDGALIAPEHRDFGFGGMGLWVPIGPDAPPGDLAVCEASREGSLAMSDLSGEE